jgi:hypothetical protein
VAQPLPAAAQVQAQAHRLMQLLARLRRPLLGRLPAVPPSARPPMTAQAAAQAAAASQRRLAAALRHRPRPTLASPPCPCP